jgi:hypothetical protein
MLAAFWRCAMRFVLLPPASIMTTPNLTDAELDQVRAAMAVDMPLADVKQCPALVKLFSIIARNTGKPKTTQPQKQARELPDPRPLADVDAKRRASNDQ